MATATSACFLILGMISTLWAFCQMYMFGFYALLLQILSSHKKTGDLPKRPGKVAIVTGGTSGIGFEVVKGLLARNVAVYIGAHKLEDGDVVLRQLKKEYPKAKVDFLELDLSSLRSIRNFAANFRTESLSLHLLINNAAVMLAPHHFTQDSFEENLQVNYLGHFYLTYLLLDMLEGSAGEDSSRIVNVSSVIHRVGCINTNALFKKKVKWWEISPHASYYNSKLAIVLSSYELDQQLREKHVNVSVNCLHPGIVDTPLYQHTHWSIKWLVNIVASYTYKCPEQGADTVLYVALSTDLDRQVGGYYDNCERGKVHPAAFSQQVRRELWTRTCEELNIPCVWG